MVDNAGLGPAYAYGSPDIPPKIATYYLLTISAPSVPRLAGFALIT